MNLPVAPQSKNPSSTISISFCFSLEILIGKYMVLRSTRATKQLAIDRVIGGADVETVLLFKNPRRRRPSSLQLPPPLLPSPSFHLSASIVIVQFPSAIARREERGSSRCCSSLGFSQSSPVPVSFLSSFRPLHGPCGLGPNALVSRR